MAEKTEITKIKAEEALNAIVEAISNTLANGEEVVIFGLGKFEVRERASREGRNPQTGEVSQFQLQKLQHSKILKN